MDEKTEYDHLGPDYGRVYLVIPSLTNSENGRLRRDGNEIPYQTQNSSKQQVSSSFRVILRKTRFLVEKHEDESDTWQQKVKSPITVAMRANSPRFQSFQMKKKISQKSAKPSAFGAEEEQKV